MNKADKFLVGMLLAMILVLVIIIAAIAVVGYEALDPGVPSCQEDEAWWWTGVDQRGCVPMDYILILEGGECG